jgi:hypothetical protein
MSTTEIKTDIAKLLKKVEDKKILKAIYAMLAEISKEEIVGYEANGKPISMAALQKKLNQSENDIANGRVMTTEKARAHFRNKFNSK